MFRLGCTQLGKMHPRMGLVSESTILNGEGGIHGDRDVQQSKIILDYHLGNVDDQPADSGERRVTGIKVSRHLKLNPVFAQKFARVLGYRFATKNAAVFLNDSPRSNVGAISCD